MHRTSTANHHSGVWMAVVPLLGRGICSSWRCATEGSDWPVGSTKRMCAEMAAWSLASWSGVLRAAFERIQIHIRFMYETYEKPGSTRMNRARLSRSEHSVFVTLDDEPDDAAGLPEMSWIERCMIVSCLMCEEPTHSEAWMYATLDAAMEPVGSVGFLDSMLQVELFLPCNLHFMYMVHL